MLCYGFLLESKFSLKQLKEFGVYIIIEAITFNEDKNVYHNFSENIPFFKYIFRNLEIETIFQGRMGYGIENLSWGQ